MVPPPCCFPDSEDTDSPDEYELAPTTVSANAQGAQESLTPAAIQGNQEASICALDIPEILSAVGESFYLTYGGKKYLDTNRDKIKSLLSFIPVSKLWYKTFNPILWFSFDSASMDRFTRESISYNSPLLRILTSFRTLTGTFNCTRLFALELLKDDKWSLGNDVTLERNLLQANLGLRILFWDGLFSSSLEADDFAHLSHVNELFLRFWDNNGQPFINILHPMAITLTTLKLCGIRNFSLGNEGDNQVVLQQLEEIRIDIDQAHLESHMGPRLLQELVVCSPGLKRFGLMLNENHTDGEYAILATKLRERCPLLQELEIHAMFLNADRIAPASLIKESSTRGLTKLAIASARWSEDLFSAILSHAGTLVDLQINWDTDYYLDKDGVDGAPFILHLLVQCQQLKTFTIKSVPWEHRQHIFGVWKSTKWGCSELENFALDFYIEGKAYKGRLDADSEEMLQISGTNPIMGWYLHGPPVERLPGTLRILFQLLEGKKNIRTLTFDKKEYTRS